MVEYGYMVSMVMVLVHPRILFLRQEKPATFAISISQENQRTLIGAGQTSNWVSSNLWSSLIVNTFIEIQIYRPNSLNRFLSITTH